MKKQFTFLGFLVCFLVFAAQTRLAAQELDWAVAVGGGGDEGGQRIKADKEGNIYVAGFFGGTTDFNPGSGSAVLTSGSEWSGEGFITKWNKDGDLLWAKKIGSADYCVAYVYDLEVDNEGNLYLAGYFSGTVDFNPDAGVNPLTNSGSQSGFVAKYNKDGVYQWAKKIGNSGAVIANALALDAAGSLYVTGEFNGEVSFDISGGNTVTLNTGGGYDVFLAKLSATNGDRVWANKLGSTSADRGRGLTVYRDELVVVGEFSGTVNFDPAVTAAPLTATGSTTDAFVARYGLDGSYKSAYKISGTGNTIARHVGCDTFGNVYLSGVFHGEATFASGTTLNSGATNNKDAFVAKYTKNGNYTWVKHVWGGVGAQEVHDMAVSITGSVYITGQYQVSVDLGAGPLGGNIIFLSGGWAAYSARYDGEGRLNWGNYVGKQTGTGVSGMYGGIDVDSLGNCYVAGQFANEADLDPGPQTQIVTSVNTTNDIFIQKFYTCEVSTTVPHTACDSFIYGGVTYTSPGLFPHYFKTTAGCDSIAYLELTLNYSANNPVVTENYCDSAVINGVTYTSSGTYMQSYSTASGCDSNMYFDITINDLTASVIKSGAILTGEVSATGTINGETYQWYDCDKGSAISGETDEVYVATANGNYAVIVTVNGCADTSDCVTVDHLASAVPVAGTRNTSLTCYPNPSAGIVFLQSTDPLDGGAIRVINGMGQLVQEMSDAQGTLIRIDLSGNAPGLYFVQVMQDGQPTARLALVLSH